MLLLETCFDGKQLQNQSISETGCKYLCRNLLMSHSQANYQRDFGKQEESNYSLFCSRNPCQNIYIKNGTWVFQVADKDYQPPPEPLVKNSRENFTGKVEFLSEKKLELSNSSAMWKLFHSKGPSKYLTTKHSSYFTHKNTDNYIPLNLLLSDLLDKLKYQKHWIEYHRLQRPIQRNLTNLLLQHQHCYLVQIQMFCIRPAKLLARIVSHTTFLGDQAALWFHLKREINAVTANNQ